MVQESHHPSGVACTHQWHSPPGEGQRSLSEPLVEVRGHSAIHTWHFWITTIFVCGRCQLAVLCGKIIGYS